MVLYRQYRPQTFKDIVGQEYIKLTLENEIKTGKIAHAYLFSGMRGVGKTTTARILAKALNCQNIKSGASEPCNQCAFCQAITNGHFLDLIEIDAASNRGIDEIRELKDKVRFTPSQGKYKVFIIDEVHMLTTDAFNALLKTLEEPPSYAIFILATTEIHKIPETVVSRCQRFDFKRVSSEDIIKVLAKIAKAENVKVDQDVLESIAYNSEGSVRDAIGLLQKVFSLDEKHITMAQLDLVLPRSDFNLAVKLIEYLVNQDATAGIGLVNQAVEEGVDLKKFVADAVEILRKTILIKIGNGKLDDFALDLAKEIEKKLSDLAQKTEIGSLTKMTWLLLDVSKKIDYSLISQLPLELAILDICEMKSGEKVES